MQLGKARLLREAALPRHRRGPPLAEMSLKSKAATQMGDQGHCDGRLPAPVRVRLGRGHRQGHRDPQLDQPLQRRRGPAAAGPSRCRRACTGTSGSARPPSATTTPTSIRTNGTAGTTSATARWATWPATCMDGAFWSLKIEHPVSVEVEEVFGGTDERYPTGTRIRWDFPARGDMPPVKVYWYDGRDGDDPGDAPGRERPAASAQFCRRSWTSCRRSTRPRSSTPAARSTSARRAFSPPTVMAATRTSSPARR